MSATTFHWTMENITLNENLIDKVVKYFNPVKAQKRLQARSMMAIAGGYVGASRSRRALKGWRTNTRSDADTDIIYDLPTLRDRSRDSIRNSPLSTGAINTVCTNVVGTGLKLQSQIDREVLALAEDEADAWQSNTEREFRLFAESKECDITRTLNFAGIQYLVFRSTLESGDTFVMLPMLERQGSPYNLKLQVIEADRVYNENNAPDGGDIIGGVRKDENGAPMEYHIASKHPGSIFNRKSNTWVKVPAFGENSGRRNILHLFDVLRPGQTRGVPFLAPVIEPLKQLDRYTEAELMAAVVSGMFTVFITTESGDGPADLLPTTESGGASSDSDYKLGNGAIVGLASGEKIETANPQRPSTAFDPFIQAILRQVGVALEIPFEILIQHFTSSYSASRAALLSAWKFFSRRREWLSSNFCQPVYEAWLDEAVANGRIYAPGYFDDPIIRQAYCTADWVGPAKGMIDERAEVEAAQMRVDMGISTLAEETAQLTGGDWDKKHPQTVKEFKARKEAGLIMEKQQPQKVQLAAQPAIENKLALESIKREIETMQTRNMDAINLVMEGQRYIKSTISDIERTIKSQPGKELKINIGNQPQDINLNIELKQETKTIKKQGKTTRMPDGSLSFELEEKSA